MFSRLLERIALRLGASNIPYMVIGGQAVLLYGEPRMTKDIDVTLGVDADELPLVLSVVRDLGLTVIPPDATEFVRRTMVLPLRDDSTGIRVDLIFSFSGYERQALQRAHTVRVGSADVRYATMEDILVHKIVAGRPRDLEDARILLIKNPEGDWNYVRRWLNDFDSALAADYVLAFDRLLAETAAH